MKNLNDEFRKQAELKLIKSFVEAFDGDSKSILEKIQKLYFFDENPVRYKRVPSSIRRNVMRLCTEYKSLNP
jgi:predicted type IV restriction endonuclease